jgi:hypothetical protein
MQSCHAIIFRQDNPSQQEDTKSKSKNKQILVERGNTV